jgi:hypothetical protein
MLDVFSQTQQADIGHAQQAGSYRIARGSQSRKTRFLT